MSALEAGAPHRRRRGFVLALRGDAPELARKWPGSAWTPSGDATLWPPPTIKGGHNRSGLSPASGDGLETAVRPWPTPCARDYRSGANNAYQARRSGTPGLCDAVLGRLDPAWVETLMGLPIGWTDPDVDIGEADALHALDRPRWPAGWVRESPDRGPQHEWEPPRVMTGRPMKGRPARLRQLGNAVVPAQAALALGQLLGSPGVGK